MPIYLRQSTASQEIPLGYFVDSADGNTEETGLTIANTDIKVWKAGATTLANKNSGGATHISNGIYYAVLDATDTDTIGSLVVFVHVAGALTVRVECVVLDEVVYDVQFGTVAPATATNITAGTITNVGTLTTYTGNTPQTGDNFARIGVAGAGLTNIDLPNQTMNITGNITGNLSGSVGSVTGAVGSVTGLTPATIAAAWLAAIVEGAHTLGDYMRLMAGVLTGKSSGGGTATIVFRDTGDTKNRVSATVDAAGNRTSIGTRDGT